MAELEVCLFDVLRGVLCPVRDGDDIRVHTFVSEGPLEGSFRLTAARPFFVFELLRNVLEREGVSGSFVFHPRSSEHPVREPFGDRERVHAGERDAPVRPGGREPAPPEPPHADSGPGIDVLLSGAGGLSHEASDPSPLLLSEAHERFGHSALAVYMFSVHYSQPLRDPFPGLREAHACVERIREVAFSLRAHESSPPGLRHHLDTFCLALARDLDTPLALRALFEWLRAAELREEPAGDGDLCEMLAMLGLDGVLEGGGAG